MARKAAAMPQLVRMNWGRQILAVRHDLGRYRRSGGGLLGPCDKALFSFTEPTTHRRPPLRLIDLEHVSEVATCIRTWSNLRTTGPNARQLVARVENLHVPFAEIMALLTTNRAGAVFLQHWVLQGAPRLRYFSIMLTLPVSLPGLTGQSSIDRWLLDRPVKPGDDRSE